MSDFEKNLVINFINGDDIGLYTEEELTSNLSFMTNVIKYTKSNKWYSFCSNDIKCDYDFNILLIDLFKDDKDFLKTVIKYIYKNMTDRNTLFDILVYFNSKVNLSVQVDNKETLRLIEEMYYRFRTDVNRNNLKKSKPTLGFHEVLSRGVIEKEILDFYAERMFNEITSNNKSLLLKIINDNSNIKENKTLYLFISTFDSYLSEYLYNNFTIIESWYEKEKEAKITNNVQEELNYTFLLKETKNYYEYKEGNLEYLDILYYIARELNIEYNIYYYDTISYDQFLLYMSNHYIDSIKHIIDSTPDNYEIYRNMKKIFLSHINYINDVQRSRKK